MPYELNYFLLNHKWYIFLFGSTQTRQQCQFLYLSLIGIILRWGFLIWELIFIYCGLFVLILVVFFFFFLCCFFFHYVSAKFHLWPSSGDLPRPWIGMLSLVTVSPVITAFHSCCLSHHVFTCQFLFLLIIIYGINEKKMIGESVTLWILGMVV